ncbi:hypothetical protein [Nonomuraea dietziae]|uniref:hypothetical protein n=1 Tax=Nonomuraea dietziae TaxID=65515 RepID=UPI0031DFF55A
MPDQAHAVAVVLVGEVSQVLEEDPLGLPQRADVVAQWPHLGAVAELGEHSVEVVQPGVRPGQADDAKSAGEVSGEVAR